jgi:predicted RNase H-like nuclease
MRLLGVDVSEVSTGISLDDHGRVAVSRRAMSIGELAGTLADLAGGDVFLAGVDVPLVVPQKAARSRPVELVAARRLGAHLSPGGRGTVSGERGAPLGEAFLAALAAAGQPCLPYPDRDRRTSSLCEVHPDLVLKALLWEGSPRAAAGDPATRESLFRALEPPDLSASGRRTGWAERAARLELTLLALGRPDGYDLRPVEDALAAAGDEASTAAAISLLRAVLAAGTARRYLLTPETCVFLGDRETGYTVVPADALIRRLALREARRPGRGALFPTTSLRDRLGKVASLHSPDLLDVPGRAGRLTAIFEGETPLYEFDNLDEMLWWKHTRHLAGASLPIEGLEELVVGLGEGEGDGERAGLRLVRSRHRTLSFRFEPPAVWRRRVPPRDGRTYGFRVLRATYQTLPGA